ncbi:MAG: hypothetical protein DWI12_10785 [Planctomycetota bacterium]|jgi:hypothetical protein|nr:MAG: hypothetical protein DWI12_10785 [Planctomycetota bacterium]
MNQRSDVDGRMRGAVVITQPTLRSMLAIMMTAMGASNVFIGCATTPPPATASVSDPAGRVPADLAIEINVTPGRGVGERAKVEERAARFIVFPDGSLHGESDRVPPEGLRPARVRRLAREQMVDVWLTLSAAGFVDPALADTRGNVQLIEPSAGEVLATLMVHADGKRFGFVRFYKPGGDDEQAIRSVIRSIASLAWSSDEALAETAELPIRHDLGPDPYARFTAPLTTPAADVNKSNAIKNKPSGTQ